MNKLLDFLLEMIYPGRVLCLACGEPSRGELLCPACRHSLDSERLSGRVCRVCGYPLQDGRCSFCRGVGRVRIRSACAYRGVTRQMVHRLKFDCVRDAALVLADLIAGEARKLSLPGDTVVTWVTMPRWRRLQRGIDHGELLARAVAERLGLQAQQTLLCHRKRGAAVQHRLGREARLHNLQNAFQGMENLPQSILLVDDVCTTGATVYTCVQALMQGGAGQVTVVTAGRALQHVPKEEKA